MPLKRFDIKVYEYQLAYLRSLQAKRISAGNYIRELIDKDLEAHGVEVNRLRSGEMTFLTETLITQEKAKIGKVHEAQNVEAQVRKQLALGLYAKIEQAVLSNKILPELDDLHIIFNDSESGALVTIYHKKKSSYEKEWTIEAECPEYGAKLFSTESNDLDEAKKEALTQLKLKLSSVK